MFGQYKPEIEGFPYNQQQDQFTCPAGKILSFKTFDTNAEGGLLKIYRANYQDCKQCPLKSSCVPKSPCRQITLELLPLTGGKKIGRFKESIKFDYYE